MALQASDMRPIAPFAIHGLPKADYVGVVEVLAAEAAGGGGAAVGASDGGLPYVVVVGVLAAVRADF